MTSTQSTNRTRTLVLLAAVSAFGVAAPAAPAAAHPIPMGAGIVRVQHHEAAGRCANQLPDLTDALREAGMSGQASHVAAALTLGC